MNFGKIAWETEFISANKLVVLFMACFWVISAQAKQHKFEMTIEEITIKVAPKLDYKVFAFNGQVPGPLIHVNEGDDVEVLVTNNTSTPHTIHWHGFTKPTTGVTTECLISHKTRLNPVTVLPIAGERKKQDVFGTTHTNVNEHVGIRGWIIPCSTTKNDPPFVPINN